MEKKEYTSPYDFEGKIPLKQAVILGLQHVLAMFVGNLTPVLIITGACAAMHDADVFAAIQVSLLQNAMLIAGVVTLVQLFSIGPIGGKVPIIMGTSSGFIGVFQSVAHVMGGGVLGSQIAYQAAYCGFNVTIWLRSEGSIGRCQPKLDHLKEVYHDTITLMASDEGKTPQNWAIGISDYEDFDKEKCLEKADRAYENIKLELDLSKAVGDADLIIESMAENVEQKKDIYKKMADLLPEKTVIVTNSSTLLPSKFAKYTKRPNKYLSLHFANSIWKNNMTEVMAQKQTDQKYFDLIMDFAKEIRMIPLPVRKEKSGYLLNSMLVPLLFSGMDLYVNGISDPESIDKAWTLGTGAPKGPFQILDTVGLTTAYNIVSMYLKVPSFLAPYNFKGMAKMLKKYIDEGKLGMASGEGFYKY